MTFDRHGTCLTINREGLKKMGAGDEILGSRFQDIWHDEFRELAEAEMKRVLQGEERTMEAVRIRNDYHAWWKVSLIPAGGDGGFVLIGDDITEFKTLQNKLNSLLKTDEGFQHFKLIYDSMLDAVNITNQDFEIEFANKSCEKLFGPCARGTKCYAYQHKLDAPCPWCRNAEVFSGSNVIMERHMAHLNKYFESHQIRIVKPDGGFAKLVVMRDITDRKLQELRLEQLLREKEILTQEINHRAKNNLNVITSLLKLQSHGTEDEDAKQLLNECRSRVAAMGMIHERLQKSPEGSRIDFSEFAQRLTDQILSTYRLENPDIRIVTSVPEISLDVDTANYCGLIINELVTNAIKYAFPEGRSGLIEVYLREAGDGVWRLGVKDNGAGIRPDFNISKTDSLGMSLVRSLATQMDGEIEVLGEGGTEFRVTLPRLTHP